MKSSTVRVFGFPDIHWSDRDVKALAVAEKAHRLFAPDRTIIGGDLINCGPLSTFPKRKLDLDKGYDLVESELKPAARFIDRVQKYTRRTDFLEGNHEERVERWLRANEGASAFRSLLPSRYLSAGRTNFSYVPFTVLKGNRRGCVQLHPRLITVHGWATPKYAAQRHLDLAKPFSIIYHHTHRFDFRAQSMCDGRMVQAMSPGCLCRKEPIYAVGGSPTDWTHGFWVAYIGTRSFTIYPILIENGGAVMPDGTEIRP